MERMTKGWTGGGRRWLDLLLLVSVLSLVLLALLPSVGRAAEAAQPDTPFGTHGVLRV